MIKKGIIKHCNMPIDILQYTGDNYNECRDFVGKDIEYAPKEHFDSLREDVLFFKEVDSSGKYCGGAYCYPSGYIIKYPENFFIKFRKDYPSRKNDTLFPFYPCREDLFELFFEFID